VRGGKDEGEKSEMGSTADDVVDDDPAADDDVIEDDEVNEVLFKLAEDDDGGTYVSEAENELAPWPFSVLVEVGWRDLFQRLAPFAPFEDERNEGGSESRGGFEGGTTSCEETFCST
jgi:hypothetical protein